MRWSVRVISGLTADTEPSIEVTFDDTSSKFIFNCGESTTRSCIERKRGLRKVKSIFLTRVNTQTSGGLPGLLMSLADIGVPDLQVFGPPGLSHFIASMRQYVKRDALAVSVVELPPTPPAPHPSSPAFDDGHFSVYAIPISPAQVPKSSSTAEGSSPPLKRKRDISPDGSAKRVHDGSTNTIDKNQPNPSHHPTAVSFDLLSPEFVPESLRGEEAQAWRQRVVQGMFRSPTKTAPPRKSGTLVQDMDHPTEEAPTENANLAAGVPFHTRSWRRLPRATRSSLAVCYIGVGPILRGKFDARKAEELGIPSGRLRGRLTKGETIVTPEGVTVTPDMCIGPSQPATSFIMVDCPSPAYIDGLVTSPAFSMNQYGDGATLNLIIHRVGNGVLEDERYRSWMSSFGPQVHHVVANEQYCHSPVVFNHSAHNQLLLSMLDPEIFRLPHDSLHPAVPLSSLQNLPPSTQVIYPDLEVVMIPPSSPKKSAIVVDDRYYATLEEHNAGTYNNPFAQEYTIAQQVVKSDSRCSTNVAGSDVLVTPLGTGSALASKYRNVSSTLIQIPDWGNILLDCGEGTWGQMARRFGDSELDGAPSGGNAWSVLRDVKCIFISHIHGDHHIGLSKLLAKRKLLDPPPTTPLTIIAGPNIAQYLREYNDLQDIGLTSDPSVQYLNARLLLGDRARRPVQEGEDGSVTQLIKGTLERLGLEDFQVVEVIHRSKCYGCVIRHQDGWSIVFSGDTKPCDALVDAGKDTTLLIHEATMADEEVELAELKAHSTFGQAIDVGKRMNAKNILLTHFSQRYPKVPIFKTERSAEAVSPGSYPPLGQPLAPVALAFDCMTVSIGSMWKMPQYADAIAKTFESPSGTEEEEEGEDDTLMVDVVREVVLGKSNPKPKRKAKANS